MYVCSCFPYSIEKVVVVEEAAGDGEGAGAAGGRVGRVSDARVWLWEEGERGSGTGVATSFVFFFLKIICKIN